jgi:hypothetical protein
MPYPLEEVQLGEITGPEVADERRDRENLDPVLRARDSRHTTIRRATRG